ncbi:MAG: hypothetical protein KBF99_16005 [Leptospiraceae bacterium]|jgi:hypothetical protein|nr:hypothetical protein [Leptospiraceae bacterium]MBK7056173.1 hypothetical protein [Leptospiraceae bacterium]MBK9498193.1 hypothetical protein [Leptospiraceae bacterium]MBP9164683.1 hypothetical protein [Leptospiraceae bacterium]HRG46489.1 hypothetical protein [Leptospiraceae bacterium]
MKKPKKVLSNRTPTIIKDIQQSLDTGVVKKEGYVTIAKVKDMYKVKKGKDTYYEGKIFRPAYDVFLKLVLGKM